MHSAWICMVAVAVGPAWAHGDHNTGAPMGAARQDSWWLDLVPRASAAQQMEVDERQGVR